MNEKYNRKKSTNQTACWATKKTQPKAPEDPHFSFKTIPPFLSFISLILLTFLAYIPALKAGYIWDDGEAVLNNTLLRSARGLWRMWSDPSVIPQSHYWPLVYTTFWLEYRLWNTAPLGYHLTNILLHGLNAAILWLILRRMAFPAAWLAAAIFALHPVHVESVAWVVERKNVLSGLFYFLSFLFFVKFKEQNCLKNDSFEIQNHSRGRLCHKIIFTKAWIKNVAQPPSAVRAYAFSFLLFTCAMLSKSAVITFPVALLLWLWWKKGRLSFHQDILPCLPFFVVAAGLAAFDVWVMRHHSPGTYHLSLLDRLLIAGRAPWFYAGKLLWPAPLMAIYPLWKINAQDLRQYIWPLALIALLGALYLFRRRIGRGPLAAVLFFCFSLGPVLGFIDFPYMGYSYVADHFQYLPSIGLIMLLAGGAAALFQAYSRLTQFSKILCSILLLVLGFLTWKQSATYKNMETLFSHNLKYNPAAWAAHTNLGFFYMEQGKIQEAERHYLEAIRLNPQADFALNNMGTLLARRGQFQQALDYFNRSARANPQYADAHGNIAFALAKLGRHAEALPHYEKAVQLRPVDDALHRKLALSLLQLGRAEEGVKHLRAALRLDPNRPETLNHLAWTLATNKAAQPSDNMEAVRLAERACELTQNNNPMALDTLAAALARAGRFAEAIKKEEQAITAARETGHEKLITDYNARLESYRQNQPWQEAHSSLIP